MTTDSVAEFLTRIRNSVKAHQPNVDMAASRIRLAMAEILKEHGFIKNYRLFRHNGKGILRLYLKYFEKNRPVIQGLRRISRPSRRVYRSCEALPKALGGVGINIISTSKGIMTDKIAKENRVGGEVMCTVW